jgi:hypothetical protein
LEVKPMTQAEPYSLITIQELKEQGTDDTLLPHFDEGWNLRLAQGEQILWQGTAKSAEGMRCINSSWRSMWTLDQKFSVTVTNQRVVYVCRKYKKGGAWFGGALALAMQAAEAAIAAFQRRGKAAIGQVRYEWPVNILAQTAKIGIISFSYLVVTCKDSNGLIRIKLRFSTEDTELLGRLIADAIAAHRDVPASQPKHSSEGRTSGVIYAFEGARPITA